MSSILEALRKVEAEKAKKKVDLGEVEEALAEKDLLVPEEEEPDRRPRSLRRALTAVTLVALACAFGVAAFFLHSLLKGAPPEQVTETQAAFPVPAQLPEAPVEVSEQVAGATRMATGAPSVAPPAVAGPTAVPTQPPAVEGRVPEQPATPETVTPAAAVAPDSEQTTPEAAVKPTPQRPKLKINILRPASEQFPTPLAVVNGKKVGIGDNVDGAQVIEIQSEGIVFEYGDDLFLVKF